MSDAREAIPLHIYSFWNTPNEIQETAAASFALMRQQNPGWQVTILHPNISGFEPPPIPQPGADAIDAAHTADWYAHPLSLSRPGLPSLLPSPCRLLHILGGRYRLAATAEYGGVWLDATDVVLQNPLAPLWVNLTMRQQQGFVVPEWVPGQITLENWGFASPAQFPLTMLWRDTFRHALMVGCNNWVPTVPISITGSILQGNVYLCSHIAWRGVARRPRATTSCRSAILLLW